VIVSSRKLDGCRHVADVNIRGYIFMSVEAGKLMWLANASQLSNFSRDTFCSSCRAREAAFGCEAVVSPADTRPA
jgi:hypothetical protein